MNLLTPVLLLTTFAVGDVLSSKLHYPTALPEVLHSGYLADTQEVADAKNAHLATLSHQSQTGNYGHHGDGHSTQHGHHGHLRYHGPIATPYVLQDGHIADTEEVAAAKAEHYAAVAKARAQGGYRHGGDYSGQYAGAQHGYGAHATYQGPIAKPVVLSSGYLADTYEVAHAKQYHLQLLHSSESGHHIVD